MVYKNKGSEKMNMDKIMIFKIGAFSAVGLFCIGLFLQGVWKNILNILSIVALAGSLFFLTGGFKLFQKKLSPDDKAQEKVNKFFEHEQKMDMKKQELEMQNMNYQLEKRRFEIAKLRSAVKAKEPPMFPDILKNLEPVMKIKKK